MQERSERARLPRPRQDAHARLLFSLAPSTGRAAPVTWTKWQMPMSSNEIRITSRQADCQLVDAAELGLQVQVVVVQAPRY
jgi:hypothetical protein